MTQKTTNCPDCETEMQVIKLIDNTALGHTEIAYAAGDAKPDKWMAQYPKKGNLVAKMCPLCGRVLLFGGRM